MHQAVFQNTIPLKGYYYHSVKSSAEVWGPEYIQAATCLPASLPPPLPPFSLLPSFLLKFLFASLLSFLSVSYLHSALEPVARISEYIVGFAINPSTRRNTSVSAKCPRVRERAWKGYQGWCSSVYGPSRCSLGLYPLTSPNLFAIKCQSAKHEFKTKRSELLPRWTKRTLENEDPAWNNHRDKNQPSEFRFTLCLVCFCSCSLFSPFKHRCLLKPEVSHHTVFARMSALTRRKGCKVQCCWHVLAIWEFHKCISPFNVANFLVDFLFFPFSFFLPQKEIHKGFYLAHELTLLQDHESHQIIWIIQQVV